MRTRMSMLALILMAGLGLPRALEAQQIGRWMVIPAWSPVLPVGEATTGFVDHFSWRGGTVDILKTVTDRVRVGVSAGWHVLDDAFSGTVPLSNGALTGTFRTYFNSVPLLAVGSYRFGGRWAFQPVVQAGTGTIYGQNRVEAGTIDVEDGNWHWGLMAGAGLEWPRPSGSTWSLVGRYYHALEANGIERQYVTFSLGYRIGG